MSFFLNFEEFQETMKIMKRQPTIAHGLGTHTIACVFHDFEGFQEMTKIMKKRHTIVCRFFSILKNFKKR